MLAGTLGFGTIASAQEWEGHRGRENDQRWEQRHDRRAEERSFNQGWQAPRYAYNAPHYAYNNGYYAPRFYRGGYLPREYLSGGYYVNWQAYPGLYAPPYGYQWVNVDGNFLLVALATGLIANALLH
jgi:Ni/Co efflux regulator RcnB